MDISKLDCGVAEDLIYLAYNWFFSRIKDEEIREGLRLELSLPNYIGKL